MDPLQWTRCRSIIDMQIYITLKRLLHPWAFPTVPRPRTSAVRRAQKSPPFSKDSEDEFRPKQVLAIHTFIHPHLIVLHFNSRVFFPTVSPSLQIRRHFPPCVRFISPRRESDTNLDSFARSSSPFVESADSWFSGWRYRRRRWRGLPAGVSVTGKVASWAGALTFVPGPLEGVLTLGTAAGASGFAGRQQRWSAGQVSRNIGEVEIIRLLEIMSIFF